MMIRGILNQGKALRTLRKTAALLASALRDLTPDQARTLRDGPDGWSILLIVCHLRDYEIAWQDRVEALLTRENPVFTTFDHMALIERNQYASQDLQAVLSDLADRRAALIARLEPLSDAQWMRAGSHPEQGPGTLLEVAINAGLHDLDHLEQITRCLVPLRAA
jgi:DinB superfamily